MRGAFIPVVCTTVTLLAALPAGGCRAVEKSVWRSQWLAEGTTNTMSLTISFSSGGGEPLIIDRAGYAFAGDVEREHVVARYAPGLEAHALAHAETWQRAVNLLEDELAFRVGPRVELLVVAVDQVPANWRIADSGDDGDRKFLTIPIFVPAAGATPPATTRAATTTLTTTTAPTTTASTAEALFPRSVADLLYLYIHEWVELSLFVPGHAYRTLPDVETRVLGLPFRSINHTRWFRDGYANYAARLVAEEAEKSPQWRMSDDARRALRTNGHGRPFSMLDRVGPRLFKWHQFSPPEWDRECYDAALGLFLLIEHRFGREAVREITEKIATLEFPDGPALLWACNRATGVDVRRMIEQFDYPDMGLRIMELMYDDAAVAADLPEGAVVESVKKDGPAHRAGVEDGYPIVAVDDDPVRSPLELEQAIFRRIGNATVKLSQRRKDTTTEHVVELRDASRR